MIKTPPAFLKTKILQNQHPTLQFEGYWSKKSNNYASAKISFRGYANPLLFIQYYLPINMPVQRFIYLQNTTRKPAAKIQNQEILLVKKHHIEMVGTR